MRAILKLLPDPALPYPSERLHFRWRLQRVHLWDDELEKSVGPKTSVEPVG
jgi:hypothetical protein